MDTERRSQRTNTRMGIWDDSSGGTDTDPDPRSYSDSHVHSPETRKRSNTCRAVSLSKDVKNE